MSDINYRFVFGLGGDNKILSLIQKIAGGMDAADKKIDGVNKKLNLLRSIDLSAKLDQINRVASGLSSLAGPGADLSNQMHDLQAITGVAGDKLKLIETNARNAAKQFGGDAADKVNSYKLLLSQLSPEIAKVPAALKVMGDNVGYTSKLMGGDAVGATNLLTTSMNQYGVSTDDPIKASQVMAGMMNVMAAAAKEGSAELPQIQQALENSGAAAKAANVSFEETNAAIQVLDKNGKRGAEGGVAIRNMLAIMGQGRFLPPETQKALKSAGVDINAIGDNSKTLAQRLNALKPVMNDSALLTKLFGMENQNAARALISGVPLMEQYTTAITGTNEAYKQAAIVMDSPLEKNARLKAQVDDFKISLYNGTNGWLGYMGVVSDVTRQVTDLIPIFSAAANITKVWDGVQTLLNATFWANPITWIVAGIVTLIGVISYVIYKTDGWGKMWQHTVTGAGLIWDAFVQTGKNAWDYFTENIMIGLNAIKKGWYEFQNTIGLGDEGANNKVLAQINADTEARKKVLTDGTAKSAALYSAAGKEFTAAGASLSWNSGKKLSDILPGGGGISAPGIPGATGKAVDTGAGGANSGGAKAAGKNINDAIATGGAKSTTINIRIDKQVEKMVFEGSVKENEAELRDRVTDIMTRAVAMGASMGGAN